MEVEIFRLGKMEVKGKGRNQRCLPSIWLEQVGGNSIELEKTGEEKVSDGSRRQISRVQCGTY